MYPSGRSPVVLARELIAMGYSHDELARLTRRDDLVHLRRGAYSWASGQALEAADQHLMLVRATVPLVSGEAVVSHCSAAVLHELPVWGDRLTRVHVTRTSGSGKRRGKLHVHAAPLAADEIVVVSGIRTTSTSRTVVDLARSLPYEQAVAAGDAAVRAGCRRDHIAGSLELARGRPGVAAARRVVEFVDGRSESPGESLSRVVLSRLGLPAPQLQYAVLDDGLLVGRTDFCWEEQRTLGEFDGKVKYGRLVKEGETAADAVYREKRREDALRDLGWQVVRWSWGDLKEPRVLGDRLTRAFSRGRTP